MFHYFGPLWSGRRRWFGAGTGRVSNLCAQPPHALPNITSRATPLAPGGLGVLSAGRSAMWGAEPRNWEMSTCSKRSAGVRSIKVVCRSRLAARAIWLIANPGVSMDHIAIVHINVLSLYEVDPLRIALTSLHRR